MNSEMQIWTLDELILADKVKLGRGDIISKKDIANFPGDYPIYSSAREKNGTFGFYGKYMFDEELITWSIDGGGRLFYRPAHKFSVTNVGGTLRILDKNFLDCRYLHLVLTHLHSKVQFDWVYKAHPSVIRAVYNEIPIPSLESQLKIVKNLDSVFAEIDSLGEGVATQIKNVSELFAEICLVKTQDLNPAGFKSLKEIATVITKGTTPTSLGHKFTPSGINFLKVESLNENGGFIESKFAFIDRACHEILKLSQLVECDVLVSIAGALGRTAIVTADICPANVNQALSLIRLPKDAEISPDFLIALFQSGYFKSDLERMGAGAAQQNLSLAQIGSLKVPIFSESKQKEFIDFLNVLQGLITDLKNRLENQYLLKFTLHGGMLNGPY